MNAELGPLEARLRARVDAEQRELTALTSERDAARERLQALTAEQATLTERRERAEAERAAIKLSERDRNIASLVSAGSAVLAVATVGCWSALATFNQFQLGLGFQAAGVVTGLVVGWGLAKARR